MTGLSSVERDESKRLAAVTGGAESGIPHWQDKLIDRKVNIRAILDIRQESYRLDFRQEACHLDIRQESWIHDLIEKRRGVPHMTLKGLALLILPQVDWNKVDKWLLVCQRKDRQPDSPDTWQI